MQPYLTPEEIELIKECIERFIGVEGLLANDGAMWRILKHEKQKEGSLLELEYIVELSDQGSKIIKMGEEVEVQAELRNEMHKRLIEIDIETDTELIECKFGVWELKRDKKIEELQDKLLLGNAHSKKLKKSFVVVSKKPIPAMWKNWLAENNINYREKNYE